jgi:transposase InsO family protein
MPRKSLTRLTAAHPLAQTTVPAVASFPGAPSPSASFDWRRRAIDYDSFVYNWSQPGQFPTIAWDHTHYNMRDDTYKMPSYYGDSRLDADGTQEALGQIASVVGATLVGIDKSNQDGMNYVDMLRTFYWPSLGIARNQPTLQTAALDGWLWHYNHRQRHSALGHQAPVTRTNLLGSYI